MTQRCRDSVYGYVRENYDGVFITDIVEIIYEFYLIRIESNILSSNEESALMDLLHDALRKQQGNENMRLIETQLLYRASEQEYDADKFNLLCCDKGATISIFHNEHNHVFGGYASKSWPNPRRAHNSISDDKAFLFMIRPKIKFVALKEEYKESDDIICGESGYGPIFGTGWDIYTWHGAIGKGKIDGGGVSDAFGFSQTEMTGGVLEDVATNHTYELFDYEVFSISLIM